MIDSIAIPGYIANTSVPGQVPQQSASQHDVHRFEQALAIPQALPDPSPSGNISGEAIREAIAIFENAEIKNKAVISKLFTSGSEITPLTVLISNIALEERSIGYSFARQLISAPSQWIKELTTMQ